ncbi:MAG: S9 family peptidase [Flavobacteriales bacterium]|nr:S9 family peptidase [Flavobacteriales bacterium]
MKKSISFFIALMVIFQAFSQEKKPIALNDIWASGVFYPKMISGFVNLKDGKTYCKIEQSAEGNTEVVQYNYETGAKTSVLIDGKAIAAANGLGKFAFGSFNLSEDETKALIPLETEGIYRHSTQSIFYVWDKTTNRLSKVSDKKIMYATFNPQANKVAYVLDNNLYVKDLVKNKTKQLTTDGAKNSIINGAVDWVYEEEFSMSRGFEWNADGTMIAYYRFDESRVKEWDMTIYGSLYPEHDRFKYPKAGEQNSVVDVYITNLKNKGKKIELGSENDQYLPRIKWTKNPNKLSVQRLNRHQNHWELLMVDAKSRSVSVSLDETDNYYIDINDDLIFLNDNEHFIIKSERSGYWHLYMHKLDGPEVFTITKGNWEVESLLGVDEKNGKVYYTSTEVSPLERHIYVVDFDGKNKKKLTTEKGTHTGVFTTDFSLFFHTYNSASTPFQYSIKNSNGELVRMLEDNAKHRELLNSYNISPLVFEQIKLENGVSLNSYTIKPNDFDPNKKYPLLMFVYGGPGSQQVQDQWLWSNYFYHQMLANQYGYIIACVDNRGTGARGAEFKKMTYKQLGKYETEDQIAAAKFFGNMSYIDESRIGIWGWSFGGYMSSLCITKGADVFKTAIAVAPVTNWRYYDNVYTERFMQTPQENASGYDENSPINFVDNLKGNYLIIHGTADDNVHFQNSAEMVNKMIMKNIPFDSEYYPNKNHGISGGYTRLHLYTRMTNYILEKL